MKRKVFIRLISCALMLCLLPGILMFPVSAKRFDDVSLGLLSRDFFDAINYISDNGIMNGTDPTHFSPFLNITRGMFVTVLYRYSGSSERYPSNFTDVASNDYYYYSVGWASHYGIVNGVTPTTFEPESIITKEQMAVILYRYATNYEDKTYNPNDFSSITGHPDYSSVSSYAREAVRWAKTYRVFPLTSNNQYINATANMNRAYAALYVTNYAKNVTGFQQQDRFSFTNNQVNFHTINVMSSQALARLDSCINNYCGTGSTEALQEQERIRNYYVGKKWKGSCFGYTMSMLFDKMGKIDFNKNFGNNAATMNEVGTPIDNAATVESSINYYQSLHSLLCFKNKYNVYKDNSLRSGLDSLYQQFRNYGAMPFSFFWNTTTTNPDTGENEESVVGHTVLLVDILLRADGDYDLSYINPNNIHGYIPETKTLKILVDGSVQFLGFDIIMFYCYPTSTINWFDNFDLDGNYNDSHYIPVNSASAEELAEFGEERMWEFLENDGSAISTASLTVPATKFRLTNASGDTLYFDGKSFSGTMDIISECMVPNGPDSPCTLIIELPESDHYEYTNFDGDNTSFSITSDSAFGCISGSGICSVLFDAAKNVLSVDGKEMDFALCLRTNIPQFAYFYLNGNNDTCFSVGTEGLNIITDGLAGEMTCGYAPVSSLIPETAPLTLSENCSLDFSNAAINGSIYIAAGDDPAFNSVLPIDSFVEGNHYD